MKRHFHEELEDFKKQLLEMSELVKEAIEAAIEGLLFKKTESAEKVFEMEKKINHLEIEIDDKGHSLLALGQPMANDLRLLTAILKMNTDLERLGDHAVNIAERAIQLAGEPCLKTNILPEMTLAVEKMLKDALEAFLSEDVELARQVLQADDEVDAYNDLLYARLEAMMEKDPAIIKAGMKLARIGHDLERIADLANNIAEDVIYLKQGKEVRHRIESS